MSEPRLNRTPLADLHEELGARMVPFAGFEMPVQYPRGILAEHLHTRAHASLFDVSHMGQIRIEGSDAAAALESLLPADIVDLAPGRMRYTFLTDDRGGILDDLMVGRVGDALLLVANAARKAADFAWLKERIGARAAIEQLTERALLALQGPQAAEVMARVAPEAVRLPFMSIAQVPIDWTTAIVSRSGYTGEDGFELSVAAEAAEYVARLLLAQASVAPAGLGARDSLRLEAGLCLYGHDIDETTTPVEAGLAWAIPKARRKGGAREHGYPGAEVIARQLEAAPERLRLGLTLEGRAPIREGEALFDGEGRAVGRVTSGGFGASVNGPIAMAYVASRCAAPGTELTAVVRERPRPCRVAAMPFVPHRYFRGPTP